MKNNLFISAISICAAVFSAVSCTEETGTPEPNFPETFTESVGPGDTYSFNISPNQKWEVSIPASQAGDIFWIEDGGRHVTAVGGEAGEYTVTLGVTDRQDFESHTVTVSMTMGGITQEIGTLTLGSLDFSFSLYAPAKDDFDDFIPLFEEDGFSYQFDMGAAIDQTTGTIALQWPSYSSAAEYICPVLADANGEFSVGDGTSDWIDVTYGKVSGTKTEMVLSLKPENAPLAGAEGKVVFVNGNDASETFEYNVTLPVINDVIRYMGVSVAPGETLSLDADGRQTESMGGSDNAIIGSFMAADGYAAYVMDRTAGYIMPACDWLAVECENVVDGLLNTVQYTIRAEANTESEARSAYIVILPAGVAAEISEAYMLIDTGTGTDILDEYKQYAISVVQEAAAAQSGAFTFSLSTAASNTSSIIFMDISDLVNEAMNAILNDPDMNFAVGTEVINSIGIPELSAFISEDFGMIGEQLMMTGACPSAYVLSYSDASVHDDFTVADVLLGSSESYTVSIPYAYQNWLWAQAGVAENPNGLTVSMLGDMFGENYPDTSASLGEIGKIQIYTGSDLAAIVYCIKNF